MTRNIGKQIMAGLLVLTLFPSLLSLKAQTQVPTSPLAGKTERVSISTSGHQGNGSSSSPSNSPDGYFVAVESGSANLVDGDTNGFEDTFVHNLQTGITDRLSISSTGEQGNDVSGRASLSANGRFVAFESVASNLVSGDWNNSWDVFFYTPQTGTTEQVSVSTSGAPGNNHSFNPAISADGRFVAFESYATNLVSEGSSWFEDIYVRDRGLGITELVSVSSTGEPGKSDSNNPSISADGRFVAFESTAYNLVDGDTNWESDIFVRDRQTSTTERVSISSTGEQGNGESRDPVISADGRFVAFWSAASNLVSGDTNDSWDVFVHDLKTGLTERASISSTGEQGNNDSYNPSISTDGRFVGFDSRASNLVSGDTNGVYDAFVHDRQAGTTERVSVSSAGEQGNGASFSSVISADGRFVTFESQASNLVNGDTNQETDIFVRDRCPLEMCNIFPIDYAIYLPLTTNHPSP